MTAEKFISGVESVDAFLGRSNSIAFSDMRTYNEKLIPTLASGMTLKCVPGLLPFTFENSSDNGSLGNGVRDRIPVREGSIK